jgi:serine/threonine-protein kinase
MLLSRIGPIALEEPLGGAADSNVLRGIHLERNKPMAVKLLPRHLVNKPMGGDTFADDVKALQKLVHPNIARVYGGAMDNGQPYLAMELVQGESLRSLLDRRGRLSWETTAEIAEQACDALDYAHKAGMVHQRLTPSRIMLLPGGGIKLLGFDCHLADNDEVLGLRSPMTVAPYLAPEAFRGKQSAAEPTSDLFSLGVIIYECLTGELPWKAATPAEVVQSRRDVTAPRVSATVLECPVWLNVLVSKLLETKRGIRLATADATRRAIVDAKRKVAEGMGAAQHAWSGRQGALTVDADRREITELRKKQTNRARDESPFYERAWFLASCLAAVLGLAVWFMWPKSEEALYAAAQPLMQSDRAVDWREAKDRYLDELLDRFPKTKHRDEITSLYDRIAMNRAIEDVKNLDRFGRSPNSDAQRLYAEGWKAERFDDPTTALRKYEATLDKADVKDESQRAYAALARQGMDRIKAAETAQAKLNLAEQLAKGGKTAQARKTLNDIVSLYAGDKDLQPIVEKARQHLSTLNEPSAIETNRN